MRQRQQPIMMGSWLRMLCGIMQINEDSADHNSLTLIFLLKTESLDNAILELWLYMNHYTMLSQYDDYTRLLKIDCFCK